MKEKIQQRINQVKNLANSPAKKQVAKDSDSFEMSDSLSISVRNSQEADNFCRTECSHSGY